MVTLTREKVPFSQDFSFTRMMMMMMMVISKESSTEEQYFLIISDLSSLCEIKFKSLHQWFSTLTAHENHEGHSQTAPVFTEGDQLVLNSQIFFFLALKVLSLIHI